MVDKEDYPHFQKYEEQGHTIMVFDRGEVDGIISPLARMINPVNTFLDIDKQIQTILKSLRAMKYPPKAKKGK